MSEARNTCQAASWTQEVTLLCRCWTPFREGAFFSLVPVTAVYIPCLWMSYVHHTSTWRHSTEEIYQAFHHVSCDWRPGNEARVSQLYMCNVHIPECRNWRPGNEAIKATQWLHKQSFFTLLTGQHSRKWRRSSVFSVKPYLWTSLIPRLPRTWNVHTWRDWYLSSCDHDIIKKKDWSF